MSDPDLASQFSGPYAQTLMAAADSILGQRDPIMAYLYALSIDSAENGELSTLGGIIGYPWPAAPLGIFDDNIFLFTTPSGMTIDPLTGFGGVGLSSGGLLISATPAVGNLIPIGFYRLLLTQVAFLKSHGLTFQAIDQICQVFGPDYSIDFSSLGFFFLGAADEFPTLDAEHGLSGVDPPYDTQGGLLAGVGTADSDITVTFHTQIGAGYLWLIQQVFDRFTTAPQVFVIQGS